MAEFFIPGPAGHIQAQLDTSDSSGEGSGQIETSNICAILCHPHPQYGGSMMDGVLHTAAHTLLNNGIDTLRFNFRGVGQSEGKFDQGRGETEDLLAVHAYAQQMQTAEEIWWLGYSFGAAMVWQALQHTLPARALLIAPPVGMMEFSSTEKTMPPISAVAGDADNYVNVDTLHTLPNTDVHIIAGADHFFSGHHDQLAEVLEQLLCGG